MTSALLLDGLQKNKTAPPGSEFSTLTDVTSSREVNAQFTRHPECGGEVGWVGWAV